MMSMLGSGFKCILIMEGIASKFIINNFSRNFVRFEPPATPKIINSLQIIRLADITSDLSPVAALKFFQP